MNTVNGVNLALHQRVFILRWALPVVLGLLAVLYEIGPGRWIHDDYSVVVYFDLDVAFYGLVVPLLTFAVLSLLKRWLDRKEQAEKQAGVSERRLTSIITASADAIIGLDSSGSIESWNRGAELLFDCPASKALGHSLADLVGGSEAAKIEFHWLTEIVLETGFVRGHETTFRSAQGRDLTVEITATHLTNESGQPFGMSMIVRDVTERKYRDEEIRRLNVNLNEQVAERTRELADKVEQLARANADLQKLDRMRTEFVSVVSHQIRAPLTNMRGAVERMENDCFVVNTTCSRMFLIIDQQASRLDRLVKDVLSAAHIEAGELVLQAEPISILPAVQQAVEQIHARSTQRTFQILSKPGLPFVFADRDRVAEILANLLDNADKYSPPGSDVVIDISADQVEIRVAVRDHGRGLPASELDRVFDKFYRADSSDSQTAYGYGLGLYVCQQLVKAHCGQIWAENAPDGGAVFSFTLPTAN